MLDIFLTRLDRFVTGLFSQWDYVSTALFVATITSFVYVVVNFRDPDIHPLLLISQSQASSVRQEGESAIFRSHSVPHGTPLYSGLNIKGPGDSKWAPGKDGDLRDLWRKVLSGAQDKEGKKTKMIGKLFTIEGSNEAIEHDLGDITRQFNLTGQYLKSIQADRIGIYLPNSVEFLVALFACAFHDLTAILLRYDQPSPEILSQLKNSKADTIIAPAGSFPVSAILKEYSALKNIIWVVDEGNKHMDWKDVPTEPGDHLTVTILQDIIYQQDSSKTIDIKFDESTKLKNIIAFADGEMIEYTHSNITAGIAGQMTSVPVTQSFTLSDLFLPIDCLSNIYPLTLTLTALYCNASVALTAVASHSPSLCLATRGVSPTIIAASSDTMLKFHDEAREKLSSPVYTFAHWLESRDLIRNGVMPAASFLSRFFDRLRPAIGGTPGKLRLIYISSRAGKDKPISTLKLSDLRVYTRSRIIYALSSPNVAGAVTQTGVYDYRVRNNQEKFHFGAPVTSLELFFQDKGTYKTTDTISCGEIFVAGPAVVNGKADLGVVGIMNDDLTLSLID